MERPGQHLWDYVAILRKRKWTILIFFLAILTFVALGTFATKPVYRATAKIQIDPERATIPTMQDVMNIEVADYQFYQTQHEILKSEALALRVVQALHLEGDPEFGGGPGPGADRRTARNVLARLRVEPIRDSRLLAISIEAKDPNLAAQVTNTLAEQYIRYTLDVKLSASQQTVEWLKGEVERMTAKVTQAEAALERYKGSSPKRVLAEMASDVPIAQLEARPDVAKNPFIHELKADEMKRMTLLADLSKKYGSRHPRIIQVQSELQMIRKNIEQEVRKIVGVVAVEESAEALILRREAETNRQLYDTLLKKLKETILGESLPKSNISVVDPAQPARTPIRPKPIQNLLLGALIGLLVGSAVAFFFEYLDTYTVKTVEDVERAFMFPFLGLIPRVKDVNVDRLSAIDGLSLFSEAFRTIRTTLQLATGETPPKILLVTSASLSEGKTVNVVNLGVTMAQAGNRVLLVDADLRRPRLHTIFGLDNTSGLTTLLRQTDTNGDLPVHPVPDVPNLTILPSGPISKDPAELLALPRMRTMLAWLAERYDRVILDVPPMLIVADPLILIPHVGGVVLVVRSSRTSKRVAGHCMKRLENARAKVVGVILNDVPLTSDSYYTYAYYGGYMPHGYGQPQKTGKG